MNNTKLIHHPETQARIEANLQALETFNQGDNALIETYSGWGGLRDALYNRDTFCRLKFDCGLSDTDIAAIKASCNSGYFTPVNIVRQVWAMLEPLLPAAPNKILDPATGTGHFLAHLPKAWQSAQLHGVELEPLSAKLAQARLPNAKIVQQGFEAFQQANFDLIVGNPPYSKARIVDAAMPDLQRYCIHHAFALKSFRLLNVGGFLALLLPSWFLDNANGHVRDVMAQEGAERFCQNSVPLVSARFAQRADYAIVWAISLNV